MKRKSLDQLKSSLADDIKRARAQIGLSQESLALAAEVDRTYVSQLERGIANPSIQVLYRIAAALGADITISLDTSSQSDRKI
jgi:transcriptional regulator with XRE-family HTH domain